MAFITNQEVLLPFFNEAFYLNENPDVREAVLERGDFDNGFEHFFEFGLSEGRIPREELTFFSNSEYEVRNPDVDAAIEEGIFASGLEHFLTFGLNNNEVQGRIDNGGTGFEFFNEDFYLSSNPDVANAVNLLVNFDSGLEHFIEFGIDEGRVPSQALTFFDEDSYLGSNADVSAAVENDVFGSALEHFLRFGVEEERVGTGYDFFDEDDYLAQNDDVNAAVESGVFETGLEHYIKFGFAEGRVIPPGTVTVDDVTQSESNITFEFDVITHPALNTTLDFSVVGTGTNATLPNDFEGGVNPSGTVDIIDGFGTVSFDIADDVIGEAEETFQLALTNPLDDDELLATAIGTIVDDDAVT